MDLETLQADRIFDGGDLDCGSGLILLIRENMLAVPAGGILVMRSREPSVAVDLPPWCRMVGYVYLGSLPEGDAVRYFIQRKQAATGESQALAADKVKAKNYEWRVRTRSSGHRKSTVYCRNFSWEVGQPASFEEKDSHPSAVEYLLGALSADLTAAYATECAREGLEMEDVEITARGRLINVLAHMGLEQGDPGFSEIEVKCFASTLADEMKAEAVWQRTVARSPLAATLAKALALTIKFAVV